MKLKGPDFVIGGVGRAGTTQLYEICNANAAIYMNQPARPEPKFFSRESNFSKGVDWYLSTFFANGQQHTLRGEKSTEYFISKYFAPRARLHFPELKVIMILRNPIERAISHYWWSVKNKYENRPFETAVKEEISKPLFINGAESVENTPANHYIGGSFYAQSLDVLHSHFPASQILLLNFDDYKNGTNQIITKLSDFLSIPFHPAEQPSYFTNAAERKEEISPGLLAEMKNIFYRDVQEVNDRYRINLCM